MDEQPIFYLNKKDNNLYLYPEAAKQIDRDASIPYMYFDEKQDIVFRPIQDYNSLYHYCNIGTMMNIVRSKSLWLTNCVCSNDSQEMRWAIKRFQSIVQLALSSDMFNDSFSKEKCLEYLNIQKNSIINFPHNESKDYILSQLEQNIEILKAKPEKDIKSNLLGNLTDFINQILTKLENNIFPTYVTCFSKDNDSLSQWRGYGDDGRGVAIGFDSKILNNLKDNNDDIPLKQMAYHENLQNAIMNDAILRYIIGVSDIKDWAYHILPAFKPLGFKEEQEWRLVFIPKEDTSLNMNLYFQNGILRQCYQLPLGNDYITEIKLGPKCNIEPKDLRMFLFAFGFNIDEEQIIKSELSYR